MIHEERRERIAENVARILRREREAQGYSLARVGQLAGLSYQMIGYVENLDRKPTLDTLLRMTQALQLELSEVIREAEKTEPS